MLRSYGLGTRFDVAVSNVAHRNVRYMGGVDLVSLGSPRTIVN
jgi:hypothetical protein